MRSPFFLLDSVPGSHFPEHTADCRSLPLLWVYSQINKPLSCSIPGYYETLTILQWCAQKLSRKIRRWQPITFGKALVCPNLEITVGKVKRLRSQSNHKGGSIKYKENVTMSSFPEHWKWDVQQQGEMTGYFIQVKKNRILDHPHHTSFPQVEQWSLGLLGMGVTGGGVIMRIGEERHNESPSLD